MQRNLTTVLGREPAVPRARWAIVVGISAYQHEPWNLKYADRDAQELTRLLQTPCGGGFEAEHVLELINGQATTRNLARALRSFLQKPSREDVVLIYLACHGAPDPQRPNNVYLLTHDTDPRDIPGTAFPMREIDASLRDNLLAERVIIIADTCHSAAIGSGRRAVEDGAAALRRAHDQSVYTMRNRQGGAEQAAARIRPEG